MKIKEVLYRALSFVKHNDTKEKIKNLINDPRLNNIMQNRDWLIEELTDIVDAVKKFKIYSVKHQNFETAADARDMEMDICKIIMQIKA